MAFSFGTGATQPTSLFGATATTTSSGFGFGTATTTQSTGFSFGGGAPSFGTPASSTTTGFGTGFGTGTTTSTGTTGFSFGTQTASTGTGFPGFGTPATTTSTSTTGFGGFGFGTGTSSGFGTGSSTAFGTGSSTAFGTGSSTGFGTGGTLFGTGSTTSTLGGGSGGLFGLSSQQQQQQPGGSDALANIALAVSLPQIYGDERDAILAKWNQLQAFWGTGRGFYSQNGCVDFKPDNPFCRFKAIGYSVIPGGRNEDGLVSLQLRMKLQDVAGMQQQIVDGFNGLLPNKQTQSVCVEGVRPLPGDITEFVMYVLERPASGPAKRISATDLATFLNGPNVKSKLGQLNVANILPRIGWGPQQLKEYLASPPAGLDPLLWQQAKLDNPDPERLIPVPMIGFKELQQRFQHQEQQSRLHQQRLDVMSEDLNELQSQHGNMLAKLEEYKRKHLELSHRLLQVIVKQEVYRKTGYAIQAEEEQHKVQLEAIQVELNHPTQFKGRLNELMSQIRMQNQLSSGRPEVPYQMDENLQAEIKQMLMQQQQGLQHLIQILRQDAEDVKLMEQGLALEASRQ